MYKVLVCASFIILSDVTTLGLCNYDT